MINQQQVLILDGDMVSSLTIARSLYAHGIKVDLACPVNAPVASFSRAIDGYSLYPDPLVAESEFLDWLDGQLTEKTYSLVIPVTERSLVPISDNRNRYKDACLAMPAADALAKVLDKSKTFELAGSLGISVPASWYISRQNDLESAINQVDYPVVVKPSRSVGEYQGTRQHLKVGYAFDEGDLRDKVSQALRFGEVILQQYVTGDGLGVEVLANHGEIVYAFQHKRLHEVPLTGGASSLRESVELDQDLLEASKKLICALDWHGVAMVEFKMDMHSSSYYLMEINGRFWGSLPLAVAAGADFPTMLYKLLVDGQTQFDPAYRKGVVCRRLTSDVHWYELAIRKAAPKQLGVTPSKKQMLKDFLLLFSPRHRFDVQSLSDPKPGLVEIKELVISYWRRVIGIVRDKRFFTKQRLAWKKGDVARQLKQANNILFVCYGNINRSAVAEFYFRNRYLDQSIEVVSAGFHHEQNRPADMVMQDIALDAGLDLSESLSTCLDENLIQSADIIFVMEKAHYDRLVELSPQVEGRTFLLGGAMAQDNSSVEVQDPYGKSPSEYEECYWRITKAVDELIRQLG